MSDNKGDIKFFTDLLSHVTLRPGFSLPTSDSDKRKETRVNRFIEPVSSSLFDYPHSLESFGWTLSLSLPLPPLGQASLGDRRIFS